MNVKAFIFGVTTGQEAFPTQFSSLARGYYADASRQPAEQLVLEKRGDSWVHAYVNYRFTGAGGRDNSHFGVAFVSEGQTAVNPEFIWKLCKEIFAYIENKNDVFQLCPGTHAHYRYIVPSFTRIDTARLSTILDKAAAHVASQRGVIISARACSKQHDASPVELSLRDNLGEAVTALLNGRRVVWIPDQETALVSHERKNQETKLGLEILHSINDEISKTKEWQEQANRNFDKMINVDRFNSLEKEIENLNIWKAQAVHEIDYFRVKLESISSAIQPKKSKKNVGRRKIMVYKKIIFAKRNMPLILSLTAVFAVLFLYNLFGK